MSLGRIEDFALERYFARWEFAVEHQLSASDVEPLTLAEVLALADADARGRWDALTLGYTESRGLPALRQEIAALYEGISAEQVVVLSGAEEGILLTMLALLSPGQHAVVVTPAYQSLHSVPRAAGASVTRVPLLAERHFVLNADDVERAVTRHTRVIAVNFPHNPTGAHIGRDTQRRLVEIADNAGAVFFSDEVYRGLEYEAHERLPAAADLSATAVSLGVMSKSLALAGLRIGWLASRNAPLLERVARLKDYSTICNSAPSEVLALIALRAREQLWKRSRDIVSMNLQRVTAFIAERPSQIDWIPPRAGTVALPRFLDRDAASVSTQLAEHERTLLMPGAVFGADPDQFRLGLGRRDLPLALERLARVLRSTPGA
ncbi:MAG TPA: aminotransferase class I/II-fold pyridoxal phosphate-dependent enzyme [Gemmatimonadaceae bacterium]|nr:aminotransferase class I/II-fold pyridoxal phosphate-dependent enzyme [Gemmatimonadaceae bacterium]